MKLGRCVIDDAAQEQLIERGEGHPWATMLIAQQAHCFATLEATRPGRHRALGPFSIAVGPSTGVTTARGGVVGADARESYVIRTAT